MPLVSINAYSKPKSRPSRYKARDAAYPTGGNHGFYVSALPKPYPMNQPQRIVSFLAKGMCNIRKGMSKEELMLKMKECITRDNYSRSRREAWGPPAA